MTSMYIKARLAAAQTVHLTSVNQQTALADCLTDVDAVKSDPAYNMQSGRRRILADSGNPAGSG